MLSHKKVENMPKSQEIKPFSSKNALWKKPENPIPEPENLLSGIFPKNPKPEVREPDHTRNPRFLYPRQPYFILSVESMSHHLFLASSIFLPSRIRKLDYYLSTQNPVLLCFLHTWFLWEKKTYHYYHAYTKGGQTSSKDMNLFHLFP